VVSTEDAPVPEAFVLEPNYPNPFRASTTIRFGLPEASPVRLTVYDVLGRQVAVLVDASLAPGIHRVRFDAAHLPSGMYLVALEAGGRRMTGSMVRAK